MLPMALRGSLQPSRGMEAPRGMGICMPSPAHSGPGMTLSSPGIGARHHPPSQPGNPHTRSGPNAPVALPVPGSFPPFMRGFPMDRLRPPVSQALVAGMSAAAAAAAAAAGMMGPGARFPLPGLLPMPGFPGLGPDSRGFPGGHAPFPGLVFSQEDLDMVLYGYAKNKATDQFPGHALSGLRIGELSYGMDRILAGCASTSRSLMSHVDPTSLELPEGLELFQATFAGTVHYGVFCRRTVITKGTRYGPFQGKQVNTSEIKTNDDNSFMWEIFQDGKLSHFVDGRGSAGNWLAYVNCARYAQEQNLIAVQVDSQIFYEACKDIPQGSELLVWYGDCYLQFMGIPVALKEMADANSEQEIESKHNSEGYMCERCGKVFAYRYYRDKHLKYTRCVDQGDRKFPCHLCTRSFEKRDRLRIHILHVHEKHRPHKCNVCHKSFSQSSSLNKHMRVHSGERPYKCVYCSKAFTASSILRTHIRQHSGEKPFKCKHCGKAFASHAAHDSHVRRTHTKDKPSSCHVCGKEFAQAYELKFHLKTHDGMLGGDALMRLQSFGDINMNHDKMDEPIDVVSTDPETMKLMT